MLLARSRPEQRHQQPPIFRALLPNPFITYGVVRERMASDQLQWSSLCFRLLGFLGTFWVVV